MRVVRADTRGAIEHIPEALARCGAEGARALVGPGRAELALPLIPAAALHDWLVVLPGLGIGDPGVWPRAFVTVAGSPADAGGATARDAIAQERRRALVLHAAGVGGERAADAFEAAFVGGGRSVVLRREVPAGQPEAWADAMSSLPAGIDAVFAAAPPDGAAHAVSRLPPGAHFWTTEGAMQPEVLAGAGPDAVERLHVATPPLPDPGFAARFRERFGRTPDHAAGVAYDAVSIAVHALRSAPSLSTEALIEAAGAPAVGRAFGPGSVEVEGGMNRLDSAQPTLFDGAGGADGQPRFEPR